MSLNADNSFSSTEREHPVYIISPKTKNPNIKDNRRKEASVEVQENNQDNHTIAVKPQTSTKIHTDTEYYQRLRNQPHPFEQNVVYPYWFYKSFKTPEAPLSSHDSEKFPISYRDIYSHTIPSIDEIYSSLSTELKQYTEIWINRQFGFFSTGHFVECIAVSDAVLKLHFSNPKNRRLGSQYSNQLLDTLTRSLIQVGHHKEAIPYLLFLGLGKERDLDVMQTLSRCFTKSHDFFNASIVFSTTIQDLPRNLRPWFDFGSLLISILKTMLVSNLKQNISSNPTSETIQQVIDQTILQFEQQPSQYQSLIQLAFLCWHRCFGFCITTAPEHHHLAFDMAARVSKYVSSRVPEVVEASHWFGDCVWASELPERMNLFISKDSTTWNTSTNTFISSLLLGSDALDMSDYYSIAEYIIYKHMGNARQYVLDCIQHHVYGVEMEYLQYLASCPVDSPALRNLELPITTSASIEKYQAAFTSSNLQRLYQDSFLALHTLTREENKSQYYLTNREKLEEFTGMIPLTHPLISLQLCIDEVTTWNTILPYVSSKSDVLTVPVEIEDYKKAIETISKSMCDATVIRSVCTASYRSRNLQMKEALVHAKIENTTVNASPTIIDEVVTEAVVADADADRTTSTDSTGKQVEDEDEEDTVFSTRAKPVNEEIEDLENSDDVELQNRNKARPMNPKAL